MESDISKNTTEEVAGYFEEISSGVQRSPEVEALVKDIDIKDRKQIMEYGSGPADEIAGFSEKIIEIVKKSSIEDSGMMLQKLGQLMKSFNPRDFAEKTQGFFGKLFSGPQDGIEKLLVKYQNMGSEIEKIFVEIRRYKNEMAKSNQVLEEMFQNNLLYYKSLESYIISAKTAVAAIRENQVAALEKEVAGGSQLKAMELDSIKTGLDMLERRIYTLEVGKMVALQTAPQIRMIQKGNSKLLVNIDTSFLVTIPVFKNGLKQAVTMKRQQLLKSSMQALHKETEKIIRKNSDGAMGSDVQAENDSSIVTTLTDAFTTITEGIKTTLNLEDLNKRAREAGAKRIQEIREKMKDKINELK